MVYQTEAPSDVLSFEFTGTSATYKINNVTYTATTSPYSTTINDLGSATPYVFNNTYITNVTSFPDTSNVTDMKYMFSNTPNLQSINLSNFDTSNVTTMYSMFFYCESLTSLDLSNFDTSKVTDMSYMFYNCCSLTSLDLSNFNTSACTSMDSMFILCTGLTELDLSSWDVSNVTDMDNMFKYCKVKTLNVTGWDISKVTTYLTMMNNMSSLNTLILGNISYNTYSWWYDRLKDAGIERNVTIECTIV